MIEGLEKRIIVVGAGPIGLYSAYLIKKNNPNLNVCVLEEHDCVGKPTCCGGHISISGFNKTNLSKLININSCLINKINGATIIGPNNTTLLLKTRKYQTYVVDRFKFDNLIYKLAKNIGVEVLFNSSVTHITNSFVTYKDLKTNKEENLSYTILIGADGPNSIVRASMNNLNFSNKEFIQTYQVYANGDFDNKLVSLYFSDFSKDFFSWIIPDNSNYAKLGIGVKLGINPKEKFEEFLKNKNLNLSNIKFNCSALIPVSKPLDTYVDGNKVIIGDAACFVKATSGGGINFGLKSAEILARAIELRLKKFKHLDVYDKLINNLKKELQIHYKIYRFLLKNKTKSELDEFIQKCKDHDVEKFLEENGEIDYVSSFIFKAIFYPKLYSFIKDFIDLLKI